MKHIRTSIVIALLMGLALPAFGRTRDERMGGQWLRPAIVEMLKQMVVRAFGDGLIVPRP